MTYIAVSDAAVPGQTPDVKGKEQVESMKPPKLKKLKGMTNKTKLSTKANTKVYQIDKGKQRLITTRLKDNTKLMMHNDVKEINLRRSGEKQGKEQEEPLGGAEQREAPGEHLGECQEEVEQEGTGPVEVPGSLSTQADHERDTDTRQGKVEQKETEPEKVPKAPKKLDEQEEEGPPKETETDQRETGGDRLRQETKDSTHNQLVLRQTEVQEKLEPGGQVEAQALKLSHKTEQGHHGTQELGPQPKVEKPGEIQEMDWQDFNLPHGTCKK